MRAYKNSANQSQKMLASTVQFSTYDQTPATRPHQPAPPTGSTAVCDADRPCREERPPPVLPPGGARSLRTQQRAYDRTPHPDSGPRTPPRERAVLGARDASRPNWSAFHPRAPPQTLCGHPELDDRRGLGAALHHIRRGMR